MKWAPWIGVALALVWLVLGRGEPQHETRSPAVRALGPLADLGATLEWARMQTDLRAGDLGAALEHGENALALRPEDQSGWELIAWTLNDRVSPERTPDPDERQAWLRAALGVTQRGEAFVERPGSLAFLRALLLTHHAETDPATHFPGGTEGVLEAARQSMLRAEQLGDQRAVLLRASYGD